MKIYNARGHLVRDLFRGGLEAGEQVITSAIRNPIQGMALEPILRGEG